MKRSFCFLLAALFIALLAILNVAVAANAEVGIFAGGDGSANEPYRISAKDQLNTIRNTSYAHYFLTNDIAFADEDFAEGGLFYSYNGPFYYENGNIGDPVDDPGRITVEG